MAYLGKFDHDGVGNEMVITIPSQNDRYVFELYNFYLSVNPPSNENWNFYINSVTDQARYINNDMGGGATAKPNASIKDNYTASSGQIIDNALVIYRRGDYLTVSVNHGSLQRDKRGYTFDLQGSDFDTMTINFGTSAQVANDAYILMFGGDL